MFAWLSFGFQTAGLVLAFNGVVQLCVRKITGPWKEGGAGLLAGAIIVGVSVFKLGATGLWLTEKFFTGTNILLFLTIGLVLAFNGVVQLCVRKKTGPWKEGGANLLAGAIIPGVSVFLVWLTGTSLTGTLILWCLLTAGLVLAFNGVVQLCVRKKTGLWKEGGASLLAGAIIAGVSLFWACLVEIKGLSSGFLFVGFFLAGLVLAFNGVVQLCVRKKTGPWKEGGASLLAGAFIVGVLVVMQVLTAILWGQ